MSEPTLGVIGGSGLYELDGLVDVERRRVSTPFGDPSDELVIGRLGGTRLVFLLRHARGHRLLPSELNTRANVFAMKTLGVEWILAVSAVGSLRKEIEPGHMVVPDQLIDALPHQGYDTEAYAIPPAPPTRIVEEGHVVDIGDRRFEVLHLPGHSPGSIGLWEAATGILFSGDALYDGAIFDELDESSIPDYIETMKRLREIPVRVVHAGHEPSFGRERLIELVDEYLKKRG